MTRLGQCEGLPSTPDSFTVASETRPEPADPLQVDIFGTEMDQHGKK